MPALHRFHPSRWTSHRRALLSVVLESHPEPIERDAAVAYAMRSVRPERAVRARKYQRDYREREAAARSGVVPGAELPVPVSSAISFGQRRIVNQDIGSCVDSGILERLEIGGVPYMRIAAGMDVGFLREALGHAPLLVPKPNTTKRQVLDYIATLGGEGGTAEQIADATGLVRNTAAPRCTQLTNEGWVTVAPERRPTTTGAVAKVYVLTQAGRERLRLG